jgi:hypothetical protein
MWASKESIKVGIQATTKSLTGEQRRLVTEFLQKHTVDVMYHGDLVGATEELIVLFRQHGAAIHAMPPISDRFSAEVESDVYAKREHFMRRNARMTRQADVMLLFPNTTGLHGKSALAGYYQWAANNSVDMVIFHANGTKEVM